MPYEFNQVLASPVLTGKPVAPTPLSSDNSTTIATTAFVQTVASGDAPSATSGTPGLIQLDGDLGNTAASPQVVSTHLSSPLPVAQGGTGTVTGSPLATVVSKSSAYPATTSDFIILTTGTTTITLPTAVGVQGQMYVIKNTDSSHTATVATTSAQTIDGASTISLSSHNEAVCVVSDGANWQVVGQVASTIL